MRKGTKSLFVLALICFLSGIILAIVGFISGGKIEEVYGFNGVGNETKDINQSFTEEIDSLDIEFVAGNLTIKQGDSFRIEGKNIPEGYYEFYVKDKTLYVDKKSKGWFQFDLSGFSWGKSWDSMDITIYVPSGFEAKDFDLDVAAGTVKVEDITAQNTELSMSAGTVTASNLNILEQGEIEVNAGTLNLDNVNANNLTIEQNAGSAKASGEFKGNTELKCNAGSLSVSTARKESEYRYVIDSSAGSIKINGEKYSNTEKVINNDADFEFDMECNAGSIDLKTN